MLDALPTTLSVFNKFNCPKSIPWKHSFLCFKYYRSRLRHLHSYWTTFTLLVDITPSWITCLSKFLIIYIEKFQNFHTAHVILVLLWLGQAGQFQSTVLASLFYRLLSFTITFALSGHILDYALSYTLFDVCRFSAVLYLLSSLGLLVTYFLFLPHPNCVLLAISMFFLFIYNGRLILRET